MTLQQEWISLVMQGGSTVVLGILVWKGLPIARDFLAGLNASHARLVESVGMTQERRHGETLTAIQAHETNDERRQGAVVAAIEEAAKETRHDVGDKLVIVQATILGDMRANPR